MNPGSSHHMERKSSAGGKMTDAVLLRESYEAGLR